MNLTVTPGFDVEEAVISGEAELEAEQAWELPEREALSLVAPFGLPIFTHFAGGPIPPEPVEQPEIEPGA